MELLLASSTLNRKNGYGNITYELVSGLKKAGHSITLLLPKDDSFTENDIKGVDVKRILPKYVFGYKNFKFFEYLFWKFKTNKKFDLVHSLFAFPYAPLMAREAKRMKLPFVVGAQGTYGVQPLAMFPEKYFMNYAYKTARAIHVPSEYTKTAIQKESGINYDITVVHNGVNFDRFAKHNFVNKEIKNKFAGKKILLTVGEVKSRKGQDLVIKALPEIVKKHPDVMYVMAGYPSSQERFIKLAEDLGVLEHLTFTGPVSDDEILDYFHLCDIYVHTPRVHNRFQFEGFGIVYIEAGACGKPSVAADAGGIRDAVIDGETGLVAENENVEEISEYIIKLLEEPTLRGDMGANAERYAREHDWKVIVNNYEKMYRDLE